MGSRHSDRKQCLEEASVAMETIVMETIAEHFIKQELGRMFQKRKKEMDKVWQQGFQFLGRAERQWGQ